MKTFLEILGPAIYCVGFVPYIRATLRREVKPRIASWMTWSMTLGIPTVAAVVGHAYVSAVLTGAAFVVVLTILVAALVNGERRYNWVDGISQFISVCSIVAWLYTNDPTYAVLFNIVADFFAAVPTFYHGWTAPNEESWLPFMLSGVGATVSILAVSKFDFINAGFPIYLAAIGYLLGLNILLRQKKII